MAFRSLQNGSFWYPKIMMFSAKNGKIFSDPLFTTKWHPPTPIFFYRMEAYSRGQPHPFCGGNGKGDGYRVSIWSKSSQCIFLRAKFKYWKKKYDIQCMPSNSKIRCTTSYHYDMQYMPSDYKIRCMPSYRYDMQRMPSNYKIRCTISSLKLKFSTK